MFYNLTLFLTASLLMLVCSSVFKRFKLPQAAVIIILGVFLGPAGIGEIQLSYIENALSDVAVILMLFSAGYDIRWSNFASSIKLGIGVGLSGIVTSLLAGLAAAYFQSKNIDEALYVGIALSATSIGLSVTLMSHASVLESRVGQTLLAAAIVDDILVLYLLSAAHASLVNNGSLKIILYSLLMSLLVFSGLIVFLWLLSRFMESSSVVRFKPFRRTVAIAIALLSAGVTAWFGLSPVVGGFLAGAVASSFKTQHTRQENKNNSTDGDFFAGISRFLSPLFFLAIGLQITEISLEDDSLIDYALLVIAAAMIGKLLAPWVTTVAFTIRERWLLGVALLPRAEVSLVVASVGLQQGHLSHHAMIALVITTLATTIIAATVIPPLAMLVDSEANQ